MLKIRFDNTSNQNDIKVISLYDTLGTILLNRSNVGNGISGINTDALAAGTYYIKINGANVNEFGPYTVSDTLISPIQPNDIEPNNNFIQAQTLLRNNSTTGHIGYYYNNYRDTSDCYKLTVTTKGKSGIKLDNSGNPDLIVRANASNSC